MSEAKHYEAILAALPTLDISGKDVVDSDIALVTEALVNMPDLDKAKLCLAIMRSISVRDTDSGSAKDAEYFINTVIKDLQGIE